MRVFERCNAAAFGPPPVAAPVVSERLPGSRSVASSKLVFRMACITCMADLRGANVCKPWLSRKLSATAMQGTHLQLRGIRGHQLVYHLADSVYTEASEHMGGLQACRGGCSLLLH